MKDKPGVWQGTLASMFLNTLQESRRQAMLKLGMIEYTKEAYRNYMEDDHRKNFS